MRKPHQASQIKICCSRHPFTLQRDAKQQAALFLELAIWKQEFNVKKFNNR
jgi:hypothetical protein